MAWLIVAALLLSLAAVAAVPPPPGSLSLSVHLAPVFVFAGGSVLAFVARRSRLVAGLAAIALADRAMIHFGGSVVASNVVPLLLPLNLAALAWLPEARPFTAPGAARVGLIVMQAGVVWFLHGAEIAALSEVSELGIMTSSSPTLTALPWLALLAFAAGLSATILRAVVHQRALAAGAAWAMLASFLALDGAISGRPASVHFSAAALLLMVGVAGESRRPALRDDITGLPTRLELNRALRLRLRRYALACVEIDDFRKFRDDYGAEAARRMLRVVGRGLAKVRGGGRVFYCDTNAFVVLFPRCSAAAAAQHIEAVREAIPAIMLDVVVEDAPVSPPGEDAEAPAPPRRFTECSVAVTISAGVAEPERPGADPGQVLDAASRALDRARRRGHTVRVGPTG